MSDLISRQAAINAMNTWDWQELYLPIHFKQLLEELPSAQPNSEKSDRFCKTCHYVDEFLGGIFFCRRLKKSKRVQPDFCCKKWRGEQDG